MSGGPFLGMNPEEVRQLASSLSQKAGEIEAIKSQLTASLQSTSWVGNDAQQFRSQWDSNHVPNINRVVEALREASQTSNRNAQAQEQTSSTM